MAMYRVTLKPTVPEGAESVHNVRADNTEEAAENAVRQRYGRRKSLSVEVGMGSADGSLVFGSVCSPLRGSPGVRSVDVSRVRCTVDPWVK